MRFTGKDIVILGGSSGIGLAVARAALEQGGSMSIASSRQETVAKAYYALTVDYPASKIWAQAFNATDENALHEFFKAVGPFDHLVYTAGEDMPLSLIVNRDLHEARERFEIRYWGAPAAAKHGSSFILAGGSITLTTASLLCIHAPDGLQASVQSAAEGLARALAVELAPTRVNAVSPGISRTPRWESKSESELMKFYGDEEKRLPLGRVGEAA